MEVRDADSLLAESTLTLTRFSGAALPLVHAFLAAGPTQFSGLLLPPNFFWVEVGQCRSLVQLLANVTVAAGERFFFDALLAITSNIGCGGLAISTWFVFR